MISLHLREKVGKKGEIARQFWLQCLSHVLCQQWPLTALLLALNSGAHWGWRATQGLWIIPDQLLPASGSTRKKRGMWKNTKDLSQPLSPWSLQSLNHTPAFYGQLLPEPQPAHQGISLPQKMRFGGRFHSWIQNQQQQHQALLVVLHHLWGKCISGFTFSAALIMNFPLIGAAEIHPISGQKGKPCRVQGKSTGTLTAHPLQKNWPVFLGILH